MPVYFESERLIFREFMDSDFSNLYELISDPVVMQYCSGPLNESDARVWLNSTQKYYAQFGFDYWAVFEKSSGGFIGQAGILRQQIDEKPHDCLAYMIRRQKWGYGFASEAAFACKQYGLHTLHLPQLFATVEKDNLASRHILQKVGMHFDREVDYLGARVDLYSL